jgi:hypothetical protein
MKNVNENFNEKLKENTINNNTSQIDNIYNSNLVQIEISSEEIFTFNIWILLNLGFCKFFFLFLFKDL